MPYVVRKHHYGELAPKKEQAIEDILNGNKQGRLIEDLANYLQKEWNNENILSSRKTAEKKAKAILEGKKLTHIPPKMHNTANINRDEILKDALSKGFLEDVKLEEPWHPLSFLKGEIETFPYEHKTAIFFSGISVHELFEDGGTSNHTRSALEDGYIKPENNYSHGQKGQNVDFTKWSGNEVAGIYMGFLNTARNFSRSQINPDLDALILQLEVPTDKLYAIVAPKSRRMSGDFRYIRNGMSDISSLHKMREEFDEEGYETPVQAFHHYSEIAANSSDLSVSEGIQFGVRHALPIKSILGVWDFQYFNKPIFEPLEEVAKHLKSRYPDKMPKSVSEDNIKEEMKRSRGVKNSLNRIHEALTDITQSQIPEIDLYIHNKNEFGLVSALNNDGYVHSTTQSSFQGNIRKIRKILNQKNIKLEDRPEIKNSRQFEDEWREMKQTIQQLNDAVKQGKLMEEKIEQKEEWTRDELKSAVTTDKEILMQIAKLVEQIPDTGPWAKKVIKKRQARS